MNTLYKNSPLSLVGDKYSKILKGSSVVILAAAFIVSGFFAPNMALAEDVAPTLNARYWPASPIAGQLVSIGALATTTDDYLLANTNLYLNDVNVKTCDFSGQGFASADCSFSTITLGVGLHTYYAVTTDSAGNTTRDPLVDTKSFTVVAAPNNPPVLAPIGAQSVDELAILSFTATATDVENDALAYSLADTVPDGASIDSLTGVFTWTPTGAQGPGSYTFDVVVIDSNGGTDSETITVTVSEVNVAPTANDQSVTTNEDTATAITLTATDTDLPANTLTYTVSNPSNGALSGTAPNLTYTPNANYNGSDSFTFTVSDDGGTTNSAPATVSITITAVNDAPSFTKGADQTVLEDAVAQSISGWATAISAGPTDEAGQTLDFIVSNNNNALFSAQPAVAVDGTLSYTPAANANGSATVTVSIHDNGGTANGGVDTSATQTFIIIVTAVNDAPVISSVTIAPTDPKTNDLLTANPVATDVDGDILTFNYQWKKNGVNVTGANSNTLNLSTVGNGDKNDVITVFVTATDWQSFSNTLISNPVIILNSAPIAIAPTVPSFDEDTNSDSITLSGSDADGDSLIYSIVTDPAHGSLSGSGSSKTYTPAANYNGSDSFTFKINDGTADSAPAIVSLTINPVNDAPVISSVTIAPTDPKTNDLLTANPVATDVDGDALTYTYQWKKNGTNITDATSQTLNLSVANNGDKGDAITVEVIAHDAALSSTSLISNSVTILNTAPVADAQTVSAFAEDTTQALTLTGSDADSDTLTYSIVSNPSHGALTGTAPNLTYTPTVNFNGSDSFTFKINDGTADSASATVSLTVTAVNDAPTANSQSITTDEDTVKIITLVGSDIDGDSLTYSLVSGPTKGTVVLSGNQVTYTPNLNYNGSDSFTFKVNDGTVDSDTATISITITLVNDAPVLGAIGNKTVNELAILTFTAVATDVENDTLAYSLTGTVPDGASINSSTGVFTWTPTEAQGPGSYTFNVVVTDSNEGADSETITVAVTGANLILTAPSTAIITKSASLVATTGSQSEINAAVETAISGLTSIAVTLANTGNAASPNVRISPINAGTHIQFWAKDTSGNWYDINITGWGPAGGFSLPVVGITNSTDIYIISNIASTYPVTINLVLVSDPSIITTATGTVTVNNAVPVLGAIGNKTINELATLTFTAVSTDVDGDTPTYSLTGAPTGAVINSSTGVFTWTPTEAQGPGTYPITIQVSDGNGGIASETITVTVNEVNVAPAANGQSVTTNEDIAKDITLTATDTDLPANTLTYTILAGPSNGTLSGIAPNLTYTPNLNYNGSDSFTFKVNDGTVDSNIATVNVAITAVNDAPVATGDTATINEDIPLTISQSSLLTNDTDVDNLILTILAAGNAVNGSVAISGSDVIFTPTLNFSGIASFEYTVSDGSLTDVGLVTITVSAVNDTPVATAQSVTVTEDIAKDITLSGSDADGDSLTYSVVSGPSHGVLTDTAPNLTYTPNENYNGADSFTFKVYDGIAYSGLATVSLIVTAVNDAPEITLTSPVGGEIWSGIKDITWTASDVDTSDALTVTIKKSVDSTVWTNIATGESNDSSYSWNTASVSDGNYWIKVIVSDGTIQSEDSAISTISLDNIAPTVDSHTPSINAVNVETSTITIVFSEAVNVSDGQITLSPATTSFTIGGNGTDNITLTTSPLSSNTNYTVTVTTNVEDLAGNTLAVAYSWHFITATLYSIALNADNGGWNLISLPIVPTNTNISTVLGSASSAIHAVWTYDPTNVNANTSNGGWFVYNTNESIPSSLSTMTAGHGYWISVISDTVINGSGSLLIAGPTTPPSVSLATGWNLVGYYQIPGESLSNMTNAFKSIGTAGTGYTSLFGFNNATGASTNVGTILPGDAFWISVSPNGGKDYTPSNL